MQGSDYHRIEAAIGFLVEHADQQPRLADLARFLGLSESRCHRLFHRWAGLTPKDFLQFLTLERAKTNLRANRTVLASSLESGLSGAGRLHDLFLSLEAMTPGEYRRGGAGLEIRWGIHDTPLGEALFAVTDRGLCALHFAVTGFASVPGELSADWPAATYLRDESETRSVASAVTKRMRGEPVAPLSLLLKGTPFQIKVWRALLAIPVGATSTYGDLAAAVGHPAACRAVGSAVGANPVSYLIPCHRVLRASGVIGGYRWGPLRKRAALMLDAAQAARRGKFGDLQPKSGDTAVGLNPRATEWRHDGSRGFEPTSHRVAT